ncbi:hypothetical protein [Streptomyces sp. NPDC000229]|uniref:hypothetical protein n=1 Tax=Streptomyces sp. NPDC000229 TaxID=3154247 RepID=UPI00331D8941
MANTDRTVEPSSAEARTALRKRPAAIFGASPMDGIAWPCGLGTPRRRTYSNQTVPYEDMRDDRKRAQETITAWAERYGLRRSTKGCCPQWLQRRVSRRCSSGTCVRYDPPRHDASWLDHMVAWLHGGKPAVLTSAPYGVSQESHARLSWWTEADSRLRVSRGVGWYGFRTTQIVMWRSDILGVVEPAERPEPFFLRD